MLWFQYSQNSAHLGRHPQGSAKYRRLSVKCFHLVPGQLPEEGFVDDYDSDEQGSGGPFVQLRVICVVVLCPDSGMVAVDDGEDSRLVLLSAKDGGIEETGCILQTVGNASGEVGVVVAALGQGRMGKLTKDGKLAPEEIDIFHQERPEDDGVRNGVVDGWRFVRRRCLCELSSSLLVKRHDFISGNGPDFVVTQRHNVAVWYFPGHEKRADRGTES